MLENFMQSAMFMINTALAGRLGAEALAGAGIANFTMFFVFGAVFGIGAGTLAMVARAYGANNIEEAIAAGRQGIILAIALTLLVVVLFMVYARQILQLVGAEPAIVDIGTPLPSSRCCLSSVPNRSRNHRINHARPRRHANAHGCGSPNGRS